MIDRKTGAPGLTPATAANAPRQINSRDMLGSGRTVIILHGDEQYQLRLTRANRLILTK